MSVFPVAFRLRLQTIVFNPREVAASLRGFFIVSVALEFER